ncbi:MAG: hypothetical protein ACYC9L_03965 [Sulfuricaulis sp.]
MLSKKSVYTLALAWGLSLLAVGSHADTSLTIKKCQDATGQWHYGDNAADECAQSKVTVMTDEGVTQKVIAAPLTAQELKEHQAQQKVEEMKQQQADDQAKKDALLLSTYGSDEDITYIRDRKIAQVETMIQASEDTLKSLHAALTRMQAQVKDAGKGGVDKITAKNIEQTKSQIARHEELIAEKRQEQQALRDQYAGELQRYRELKQQSDAPPPAAAQK